MNSGQGFTANGTHNPYTIPYSSNEASFKPNEGNFGNYNTGEKQVIPLSAHLSNFEGPPQQYQPPMLLLNYPDDRKNIVKAQNFSKYQLKPDSILYYFHMRQLQTIMATYPDDFPSDFRQQMRSQLSSFRNRAHLFGNFIFGIAGYSLLFRRQPWFKLTDNALNRFAYFILCFSKFYDYRIQDNNYTLQQIFANNRYFEDVVAKYKLTPTQNFQFKLITQS